ncbi:MAG: hypothetical protein RBR64_09035 [Bacteroidales bacterium]|jgi:hypothetical protein|nr:hypothetical protein [Bacteroidales bacterium]
MIGIKRNIDGDLSINSNGTLEIGDITQDVIEVVMLTSPGEMKHAPTLGAGLINALHGSVDMFLIERLKSMLNAEKITNAFIKVVGNEIIVEI